MKYSRLKTLIAHNKMSIEKACAEIGISSGGFHSMVKENTMSIKTLEKFAEMLKVPLIDLLKEESSPNSNQKEYTISDSTLLAAEPASFEFDRMKRELSLQIEMNEIYKLLIDKQEREIITLERRLKHMDGLLVSNKIKKPDDFTVNTD